MTLNSNTVKADSEGNHKLGSALREHRKALNLSLKDVADKAGLSVGFISQVERDLVSPSLSSLASIAKHLKLIFPIFLVNHMMTQFILAIESELNIL